MCFICKYCVTKKTSGFKRNLKSFSVCFSLCYVHGGIVRYCRNGTVLASCLLKRLKELSHGIGSGHALVLIDRPQLVHMSRRYSDFLWFPHSLIQIILLAACFKKTRLCTQLAASRMQK